MVRSAALLALAASSTVAFVLPERRASEGPGFVSFPVTRERVSKTLSARDASASLTDVQDTSYLIQLSFGTPAQPVKVVIDTGSDELWVDPNCNDNNLSSDLEQECVSDGSYVPSKSSTANITQSGRTITFGTGQVKIQYVVDTVGIPGTSSSLSKTQFGVATASADLADGILGLGFGNQVNLKYPNFVDQLQAQQITNTKAFGVALGAEGSGSGASVVFGGVDTKKFTGKLVSNTILPKQQGDIQRYSVQMQGISFNNGGSTNAAYSGSNTGVVLDTGSSLCELPSSIVNGMVSDFQGKPDSQTGLILVDCAYQQQSGSLQFAFPGITIAVPFADFILNAGNGQCVLGVQAIEANSGITALLGDTFLRSAYVVFDQTNNQISMAPFVNCGTNEQSIPSGSGGVSSFTGECSGNSTLGGATSSGGSGSKNAASVSRPAKSVLAAVAGLAALMALL